jgi:hypothetical protein
MQVEALRWAGGNLMAAAAENASSLESRGDGARGGEDFGGAAAVIWGGEELAAGDWEEEKIRGNSLYAIGGYNDPLCAIGI